MFNAMFKVRYIWLGCARKRTGRNNTQVGGTR
jgi:hypothetical protein